MSGLYIHHIYIFLVFFSGSKTILLTVYTKEGIFLLMHILGSFFPEVNNVTVLGKEWTFVG